MWEKSSECIHLLVLDHVAQIGKCTKPLALNKKNISKIPNTSATLCKKHIRVLNTTSSICSVASRQKVFVMPSATQPLLYHAKNGRGESLDSNTSLNVLLSNLRHYIGKKKPSLHAYICPALQEECVWCARSKHSFNLNWNCCSVESSPWGGQWRTTQHKTVLNDNASVFNI